MNWIQYFFGGFFSHTRSEESADRSLFNSILGYILAMALLAFGLFGGHMTCFDSMYSKADTFRQYAYGVFGSLDITLSGGKIQGDHLINSYTDDTQWQKNGYDLIVDLRDTHHLYDDFKAVCADAEGKEIPYEDYLKLSAEEQKNYTFKPSYSGRLLDYASDENYEIYHSYLQKVATTGDALYNESIAEAFATLEKNQNAKDYREQIYLLYAAAYYPSFNSMEFGAAAPTRDGYYESLRSADEDGKYMVLLADRCYVSIADSATTAEFVGYYADCPELSFTDSSSQSVDALMEALYLSGGGLHYLVYIANLLQVFMPVMIVWFVAALLMMLLFKSKALELGTRYTANLRICGSFMLVSGLLAGIVGFVLSFFFPQVQCYGMTVLVFFILWIARCLIFALYEIYLGKTVEGEEEEEA